jgi:hypothetical protein
VIRSITGIRRLPLVTQCLEQLSFQGEFIDDMEYVIGTVNRAVPAHTTAVSPREEVFSPRIQKVTLTVEDGYRVLAPVQ